jgi:hypothetical protein
VDGPLIVPGRSRTTSSIACATIALAVVLIAWPGESTAADVPVTVQLALYHKIWKLDRSLASRQEVVIGVLYQERHPASLRAREDVVIWAEAAHVHCVFVAMDEPDGYLFLNRVTADVFYVTPMRGADIERIARVARERQIRTMAGLVEYLRTGLSVGIGVRNDRPHIMINLAAAKAEGAAYQAQLLRMSEIIGVAR